MYTVQMISITHCSLKPASLKTAPTKGMVGRTFHGPGRGWADSDCLGPAHWSTGGQVLSMTSFNTLMLKILSKTMNTNKFCLFIYDPKSAFSLPVVVKWLIPVSFHLLAWTHLEGEEHAITTIVPPVLSQCLGQCICIADSLCYKAETDTPL